MVQWCHKHVLSCLTSSEKSVAPPWPNVSHRHGSAGVRVLSQRNSAYSTPPTSFGLTDHRLPAAHRSVLKKLRICGWGPYTSSMVERCMVLSQRSAGGRVLAQRNSACVAFIQTRTPIDPCICMNRSQRNVWLGSMYTRAASAREVCCWYSGVINMP